MVFGVLGFIKVALRRLLQPPPWNFNSLFQGYYVPVPMYTERQFRILQIIYRMNLMKWR